MVWTRHSTVSWHTDSSLGTGSGFPGDLKVGKSGESGSELHSRFLRFWMVARASATDVVGEGTFGIDRERMSCHSNKEAVFYDAGELLDGSRK